MLAAVVGALQAMCEMAAFVVRFFPLPMQCSDDSPEKAAQHSDDSPVNARGSLGGDDSADNSSAHSGESIADANSISRGSLIFLAFDYVRSKFCGGQRQFTFCNSSKWRVVVRCVEGEQLVTSHEFGASVTMHRRSTDDDNLTMRLRTRRGGRYARDCTLQPNKKRSLFAPADSLWFVAAFMEDSRDGPLVKLIDYSGSLPAAGTRCFTNEDVHNYAGSWDLCDDVQEYLKDKLQTMRDGEDDHGHALPQPAATPQKQHADRDMRQEPGQQLAVASSPRPPTPLSRSDEFNQGDFSQWPVQQARCASSPVPTTPQRGYSHGDSSQRQLQPSTPIPQSTPTPGRGRGDTGQRTLPLPIQTTVPRTCSVASGEVTVVSRGWSSGSTTPGGQTPCMTPTRVFHQRVV